MTDAPATPRPRRRHSLGSWVDLPQPVSPLTITDLVPCHQFGDGLGMGGERQVGGKLEAQRQRRAPRSNLARALELGAYFAQAPFHVVRAQLAPRPRSLRRSTRIRSASRYWSWSRQAPSPDSSACSAFAPRRCGGGGGGGTGDDKRVHGWGRRARPALPPFAARRAATRTGGHVGKASDTAQYTQPSGVPARPLEGGALSFIISMALLTCERCLR
jgi:hypothetical protein